MRAPLVQFILAVLVGAAAGCGEAASGSAGPSGGEPGTAGAGHTSGGMLVTPVSGGSGGSPNASGGYGMGGAPPASGASGMSGSTTGGAVGSGGAPPVSGGKSGTVGGASTTGGALPTAGAAGVSTAGSGGTPSLPPLDCGAEGWAVENHGPPNNRVNYVILADGYTAKTVETTLVNHINTMLARRFEHESGQPYARYRNFVNICAMKSVSANDGIGNGSTVFDGGNGGDRLADVDDAKVNAYIKAKVPASFEIDWKAVVLNQNKWENTGSVLMLWSGAHEEAAGAALHEGGHGFHGLADEYCAKATGSGCGNDTKGSGTSGVEYQEVNTTGDPTTTGKKWDLWLGTTQRGLNVPDRGATGVQGTFVGSRYVDSAQYRPSSNSMMNSLFGKSVDTSFNSVSREQMIFSIWRAVVPIDSTEPPAGDAGDAGILKVNVIDPAVIDVDWTVDGTTTINGGTTLSTAALSPGSHTITAKAYDNASTDLVKNRSGKCPPKVTGNNYCHGTAWPRSEQTVSWTVTKP